MQGNPKVNCISLMLNASEYCVSVPLDSGTMFFHGTTDVVRDFAKRIIASADEYDATHGGDGNAA